MKRIVPVLFILLLTSVAAVAEPPGNAPAEKFTMTSPAFEEGGIIPQRFTCSGENLSPPLKWSAPPGETRSFALILDDPDAASGTFVHWVVFNIGPGVRALPEGTDLRNAVQGSNDFGKKGYGGPCPPPGPTHRYFFNLYALDKPVDLSGSIRKSDLLSAMKGHIIAEARLMGRFSR